MSIQDVRRHACWHSLLQPPCWCERALTPLSGRGGSIELWISGFVNDFSLCWLISSHLCWRASDICLSASTSWLSCRFALCYFYILSFPFLWIGQQSFHCYLFCTLFTTGDVSWTLAVSVSVDLTMVSLIVCFSWCPCDSDCAVCCLCWCACHIAVTPVALLSRQHAR